MVAGGFAVNYYTGLSRPTKDIDIFVKAGDYPKILNKFTSLGYKTQVSDERWIAKIFKGKLYVDLIFGSSNLSRRLPMIGSKIRRRRSSSITRSRFRR